MIAAVTFDFWNTIATVPPGAMAEARQRAIEAACVSSDVEIEADLLLASLEQVGLDWERSWGEGRHLHPREAAGGLVRALGLEGAAREMVAEARGGKWNSISRRESTLALRSWLGERSGSGSSATSASAAATCCGNCSMRRGCCATSSRLDRG